jgi:hypothetical protein
MCWSIYPSHIMRLVQNTEKLGLLRQHSQYYLEITEADRLSKTNLDRGSPYIWNKFLVVVKPGKNSQNEWNAFCFQPFWNMKYKLNPYAYFLLKGGLDDILGTKYWKIRIVTTTLTVLFRNHRSGPPFKNKFGQGFPLYLTLTPKYHLDPLSKENMHKGSAYIYIYIYIRTWRGVAYKN